MKRKLNYIVIFSIFLILILSVFVSAKPSDIEKIEFIHYKDKSVKIEKPGKPSANPCYKFMGVEWTNFPVSYSINPNNPQGLSVDFIKSTISTSAETWDAATTSKELFNNIGGYPEIDACTIDTGIFARIEAKVGPFSQPVDPRDAVMIYRWSTINSYHGSEYGPTKSRISEMAKTKIDAQIVSGIEPVGVIKLNPHWDYNYLDYIKLEET